MLGGFTEEGTSHRWERKLTKKHIEPDDSGTTARKETVKGMRVVTENHPVLGMTTLTRAIIGGRKSNWENHKK